MNQQQIIEKQSELICLMEQRFEIMAGVRKTENKGLEMLHLTMRIQTLNGELFKLKKVV
ncbi:hypothetical protein [Flavobacterium sp. UMI-01]|uniref:hypothetical protein n=1 Tax=Flavobacterium sp. UMI-01 TaxID=1441053 RepID=UPI001C7CDC1C|nr:hypothetical protein [Flavobacterium sp. UMI-01]GIZ08490.1 hypothetical protein FUMI01_12170 [Flavobacterium sp. UMI-01]